MAAGARRASRVAAFLFAAWLTGSATAQTSSSDRILNAFDTCRAITTSDERLACFDRTTAALEADIKSRAVTIVDHQDLTRAKRSLFGFTLPPIDLFGGRRSERPDKNVEEFSEINTTIASARSVENSRVEIRLADETGALWRSTDPVSFPPRAGDKIRIRKGALGNYFISTGGRSFRGMRLR